MTKLISALIFVLLWIKPSLVCGQNNLELDSSISVLNLQKARWEYDRTTLWRRLIPQITAGVSLSKSQYLLPAYDEYSNQPSLLGRGVYHITLSWNINDLIFADTRKRAYFALRNSEQLAHMIADRARRDEHSAQHKLLNQMRDIENQRTVISYVEQELIVHRQLLELTQIKFNQAEKTAEDVFQRRLAVLNAERKLAEERAKLELLLNEGMPTE
ncbi:MAG TPA: TolC family protein [Cyclobacteriaceae bacterium]|nr:TolC family protein [Cyclobacteriaceae bacterium]